VYSIEFTPAAVRQLLRLDAKTRSRIEERIDLLHDWPVQGLDVRPLQGRRRGTYRLRVGQYRAIFLVDEQTGQISVREVGHRSRIYRG